VADSTAQPSFDQRSFERFRERLLADLSAVERWVTAIREFCSQKPAPAESSPCDSCPKRDKCTKPCEALNALLPKRYGGKVHGEGTINLNLDNVRNTDDSCDDSEDDDGGKLDRGKLQNIAKVHSVDVFGEYEQCWKIFSKKQQEVLVLCRRDGKSITQVAKELHKAPSTVWGLLDRAERKKQKYYGRQS
jgi:hypothetical protein